MAEYVFDAAAILALWGICGYGTVVLAKAKGYGYWTGIKAAVLLGLPGLLIFAILPNRERTPVTSVGQLTVWVDCPRCGKLRQAYEEFCTVCGERLTAVIIEQGLRDNAQNSIMQQVSQANANGSQIDEIIFEVMDDPECGLRARALGYAISTQAADIEELQHMLRDAVRLYFENKQDRPRMIRLHYVRDLVITA